MMSRLTRKHKPTNYTRYTEKTICLKNYNIRNANLNKVIEKLGKLEDLMEKHNIDSVNELDKLLQTLKDSIIKEQSYNCENNTYCDEQFSIYINKYDGEGFKIVKKILWERGNENE